jgi:hypothetical protein
MHKKVKSLWARRSREQAVFALGALLILVHTVDDSIALGAPDVAPTVITAIALLVAALYPLIGPWWFVVGVALFVGSTRLAGGIGHILSLADGDAAAGDYTGPSELLGALCVLGVGGAIVRRQVQARRAE